ncbi:BZ3500_MvSof-1268-A1-R1_Chr4-3g07395 [Microbotryum saponariae]|uniref:BZ3500_MvSof-1268-A1-R1_Chr4-3g07395 protein n=1 Tax=Microbotryum saponariae TaxID=289078 RepID=A0A2X0MTS9_9BASI|nr:BZ3500_MvSof-1268-A1-R1_Chr4-3g07395 [Microbotryum saponariae]SDA07058.1 BZ3501_MvSof-1269-A2-R1_Chr4-2g07104 [Microbotryum saponariae]
MASKEELPSKVGYVRLGNSGLKVSKIILGCMSYGNKDWAGWVLDEQESLPHFKAAFDLGINTWDTANVYSNGDSERIVGKALKVHNIPRQDVFMTVAKDPKAHPSKLTDPDSQGYVNQHGLSRVHIFNSVDASLERMGVDYIDLLQCHRFDYETPIEETMDALHDVSKVRYIGMSSCYAYQFHKMQAYASSKNQTQFTEMFPTCKLFGVGVIPWSPLARGYLTRPWKDQTTTRTETDANFGKFVGLNNEREQAALRAINETIQAIAQERGYSMAQIALAYVAGNEHVTAPIVGSTKLESLEELAKATHIVLTEEERKGIEEHYVPRGVLGHA